MRFFYFLCGLVMVLAACQSPDQKTDQADKSPDVPKQVLTLDQANRLARLPLKCIATEYPNKLGQVIGSSDDLGTPKALHPAFYGCFDWHSSVHGHWSLVKLLKVYPQLEDASLIRDLLAANITTQNIAQEVAYFRGELNYSYERTYGWAWLLKLSLELQTWDDPLGQELNSRMAPLTDLIVESYIDFLPNLKYPIRVGTHTNTAFGLTFAWDYAESVGDDSLMGVIRQKALDFYVDDQDCPLRWEPSGYDFLSPCLEEVDLMRRVLDREAFGVWVDAFMPRLGKEDFRLEVAEVLDRADGHLVHLDGLNFSRAWVLRGLADQHPRFAHLRSLADGHIQYSLGKLADGNYEGEHWLASFAIYALSESE